MSNTRKKANVVEIDAGTALFIVSAFLLVPLLLTGLICQ